MDIEFLFKNITQINSTNLSKLDISKELDSFKQDALQDTSKLKLIFKIEILTKIIKKPADYRILIDISISILDRHNTPSSIIFRLRIIKNIINGKYFVPVQYYLLELIKQTVSTGESDETQTYDSLNITTVDAVFVLGEIKSFLLEISNKYSDMYGFVEISNILINELKKISKGIYKEYCDSIINVLSTHSDYVRKCRTENKPCEKMIVK